jgi:ATP-binding cassette subfamily B protein/subfamily B ATP-binding cassette protein MsbA
VSNHDFHEEEVLGKAFDLPLVKRLLKFARPYRLLVAACILFVTCIMLVGLAIPLVWRKGLNDCILNYYFAIDISKLDEDTQSALHEQTGGKLLAAEEDLKLIYHTDLTSLDSAMSRKLKDNKALGERYLILKYDDLPQEKRMLALSIVHGKPDIMKKGEGFYYYKYEDTIGHEKLSREEKKLLREKTFSDMTVLALVFLALVLLNFLLTIFQTHLTGLLGQKIIMDIRIKLFQHIETLSLRFFDSNPVGRIVTRVTNDLETLNDAFTNIMINLFKDFFLLTGIVVMMVWINWELALVTFSLVPFLVWVTFYFRKKTREAFREVRVRIARINATIAEHIAGMSVVQLFHREDPSFDHFKELNRKNYGANLKQVFIFAIFRPVINMFESLALALLVWYGGGEVIQGRLNLGDLWAFFFYLRMFFQPINEISHMYNHLQLAMASSERVFMLFDETEQIPEAENPVPLPDIKGEIEFKNVSFAYKEEDVLKDVCFKVKPGEKVALVGPTGAGKSSIISLLSRFYDTRKGKILVDGVDIKDVKKDDLRSRIAVVMQDVFVFSGDIKSNIRLNTDAINDEAITTAARYAKADGFINRLPDRYDHELHERGATLSQGQRQLLSFARAVAFDPRIFVLDEATANIDTETEVLIQQAIDNLMKGRTAIVIAHRLSTVRNVDRILVLNHGRIVEEGTHQELLRKRGLYYKLYQLQYKDQAQNN